MTDKERILAEIERLKHYGTIPYDRDVFEGVCLIESFIKSLPAEPSEELEKFIQDLIDKYPINKESVPNDSLNDYYQGLRFGVLQGANWQKEKMMESAIDAKIVNDEIMVECKQGCLVLDPLTYPIGQRLKILIIKENE